MASIESLGVHTPVALPYLINEGLLPHSPKSSLYDWQTYTSSTEEGEVTDELLVTKTAVAWSQGHFIRNVYRFEAEGEEVVQAVLTSFSSSGSGFGDAAASGKPPIAANASHTRVLGQQQKSTSPRKQASSLDRALVVLLKTKMHVYFLQGANHITDLPFEISRIFPTPRGILLQKRPATAEEQQQQTPRVSAAPPNSFFSSQGRASISYLQSPTLAKSIAHAQPPKQSPLAGNVRLEALFQELMAPKTKGLDDDFTSLYSWSGPLDDFGVVTTPRQKPRPRAHGKSSFGSLVEFDGLDPAEEILYSSPADELRTWRDSGLLPLILLVTINPELRLITVWQAWHLEEKSLTALLKKRAEHKAVKARRRSSFLSAGIATGAATPAARMRDGTRESFAAAGTLRPAGEAQLSQSTRKPTKEEEEEAMASQMDPDFQPAPSQQAARENRRISSINADARIHHSTAAASFAGTAGRRATSFGGAMDRRSFGHRRSRGSTPGSIYERSIGADDESMDLDSSTDFDNEETFGSIIRLVQATYDASEFDSVFGSSEEGFKREVVVRRLHSFQSDVISASSTSSNDPAAQFKAVPFVSSDPATDRHAVALSIYVRNQQTGETSRHDFQMRTRPLALAGEDQVRFPIPLFYKERPIVRYSDMIDLQEGDSEHRLLFDRTGFLYSPNDVLSPVPQPGPYRMYGRNEILPNARLADREVGKNRLFSQLPDLVSLSQRGITGDYDEVASDGTHHRRRLQTIPTISSVSHALQLCEFVLAQSPRTPLRRTWCTAFSLLEQRPERMNGTSASMEMISFAATVFTHAVPLFGAITRTSLKRKEVEPRFSSNSKDAHRLRKFSRESCLFSSPIWLAIPDTASHQSPNSRQRQPKHTDEQPDGLLVIAASIANELQSTDISDGRLPQSLTETRVSVVKLMLGLHALREDRKLDILAAKHQFSAQLAALVSQLGLWLGVREWSARGDSYYALEGAGDSRWAYLQPDSSNVSHDSWIPQPSSVFEWFERSVQTGSIEQFASALAIRQIGQDLVSDNQSTEQLAAALTPRISALSRLLVECEALAAPANYIVESMERLHVTAEMLDNYPECIAAPFKEARALCEKRPPTTWQPRLLQLVGRDDLAIHHDARRSGPARTAANSLTTPRDVERLCNITEDATIISKTKEANRHAISQLIFSEDRRLVEAVSLMHFNNPQVMECPKQPEWDDSKHLEQQRKLMHHATTRMVALPPGDGMIHYDSQVPLLTERYTLPGFSSSCLIYPMGHTLTTERSGLTEEKVNWAYFHAGVAAGLRISRHSTGIDTSWIVFNKPNDLTNRHAGLLLALGLGGHLKNLAKWARFKYLTAKHTMTSVGLLLGVSASHLGTMSSLVTRMLSVHITRMLPLGASEMNVSSATQTAGLMGMGLLYYNTQHRRMSEIMLSEIEYMEVEDPDSGPDMLRDESYRLAAGFALGLINLGKGGNLQNLHGMRLAERLLAMAVGPRPVNAVHVFDRATAGAVIATALVFMKTGDKAIARKIDIPDTEAQFDHVRPDILLLRAMTKHIILWEDIQVNEASDKSGSGWIARNCPACYRAKPLQEIVYELIRRRTIGSKQIPLFNVHAGLAWALGLKYAGTCNAVARDEILTLLHSCHMLSENIEAFYFDGKLAKAALRRCMDVLALSAATVMAGSGDLDTFRYLRRMHGRVDPETPYGSHLAAHMAIGVLFLGGGTYTFGTSDLAVASLICAFYPLFPTDVHDNRVHLQALRHLWVLAAEARCLVAEDLDTQRPIQMPIVVTMRNGSRKSLRSPCLLPELSTIATVETADTSYWRVTLDFANNPAHVAAFRRDQRIFVRRCPAGEAHASCFSAALGALNEVQSTSLVLQVWHSIFRLQAFRDFERADIDLILAPDILSDRYLHDKATTVDDRLVLGKSVQSGQRDALWNLRVLFAWAARARNHGNGKMAWLGKEVMDSLRARIDDRLAVVAAAEVGVER